MGGFMSAHEVFEKWVQLSEQEQVECLLLIQKNEIQTIRL
jgi:hypothetical protein